MRTWNHFDQNNALKAVYEVSIHIASDDLTPKYYHRKVAREERLPFSSWATYSLRRTGKVPNAKYDDDVVFMICMTVHWKNDPKLLKQISLDIQIGFNDLQYDWSFIVKKVGVLEWMFNHMSFKLKPEFYPKAKKSSFAYYLRECNLDNKVDLSIHCMNKYYERALKKMSQQLSRELVTIAFLPLFDAYYFAEVLSNTILEERTATEKCSRAYVFSPIKGIENKCPVTSLDFAFLYPSLILTYNLSPDKIILSQKHTKQNGEIEKLHDEVNGFLRKDNGSSYLKMAYEKVLFLVVFTEKKKYYGISHKSKPKFNKELFIQEVEVVKQGSLVFSEKQKNVLWKSL
ncbi:19853_t:CDS:2 [Funneliformis geosporum]|uniref:DNA-directed DNA polymerase n=1 Tax=Funneliformis geosporum TaxID=1117311 RepID=A0A9W4WVP1_9GLOM|nr:19853_t:CDS:2 [Funneliformis geosporum]